MAFSGKVFADAIGEVGCQDAWGGVSHGCARGLDSGPVDVVSWDFTCGVGVVGKRRLLSSLTCQDVCLVVAIDTCV
jgi:hypothetical protein